MNIAGVPLCSRVLAAPMAGVSDSSFRQLCREFGAGATYTEMISAKALYYQNEKTGELLYKTPQEEPVIVELFGSDPKGLYMLNSELGGRTYSAPSLTL